MLFAAWRWIFVALAWFGLAVLIWAALRLPETLHAQDRIPIKIASVRHSFIVVCTNRLSLGYTLAMTVIMGGLLGFINSAEQVFTDVFKAPLLFSTVFAIVAGFIAIASLVNARLVERLGMRVLCHTALIGFITISAVHAAVAWLGYETIWTFAILQSMMMFCFGLLAGNFGAIAMEPLGHVAGIAASAQGFVSTVGGALIGFAIGQSFNGTDVPLCLGFFACGITTLGVILLTEKGKLFARQATLVEEAVHI
jgi:DHA1 family bicyclomycin/chloramphenicol resistance-like MFS transporter